MTSTVCVPGQVLGSTSTHVPGPGTHVYGNKILASIIGNSKTIPASDKTRKPIISVPRGQQQQQQQQQPASSSITAKPLPTVGATVLCRVTRVRQRELNASILTVIDSSTSSSSSSSSGSAPLSSDIVTYSHATDDELQFQAILRKEDIRTHADASTTLPASYRVGDIILASVISLGDERNYYISTAGNEFGVVVATSEQGNAMVPVSWKEMRDVVTGSTEARKVAKPS